MAVTTTWSVQNMTHTDADGGVFQVIWQCLAQNEGGPESAVEAGKFVTTYDASASGFVPYADLTEAEVLQWVWDSEGFDKTEIEANRTERVDAQIVKNATTATGVPWTEAA